MSEFSENDYYDLDEEQQERNDYCEKKYNVFFLLVVLILLVLGQAICFGILGISTAVYLRGGIIVMNSTAPMFTFFSGLALSMVLIATVGVKLTVKLVPQEIRDYKETFIQNMKREKYRTKVDRAVALYFGTAAAIIAIPLFIICATANYSFYDDHFDTHYPFHNNTVYYSDCDVALLRGKYDGDEYKEYKYPVYRFVYFVDGQQFDETTDEIKNPEKQKAIQDIFEKNGVEIEIIQ